MARALAALTLGLSVAVASASVTRLNIRQVRGASFLTEAGDGMVGTLDGAVLGFDEGGNLLFRASGSEMPADEFPAGADQLLTGVTPIGIGKPNPGLGTDEYCTWNPESPDDQPVLEQQTQLRSLLDGWIGAPYKLAGCTKQGTDCSGLVTSLFSELGIKLPRFSQDIGRTPFGTVVTGELHFGDVLVFPNPQHCAIYVGNGQLIEAVKKGVTYSPITRYSRAIVRRFLASESQRR